MKRTLALCACLALVAACGDAEEKDPSANNSTSNNSTSNNATTNNSTSNNSTSNNATTNNATTNNDARLEAHGCTFETANDMTGQASVDLTADGDWTIGYNYCVIVDAGTEVTLTGNFDSHPLEGGAQPTEDTANPLDAAGDGLTGQATATATLDTVGDYPYFCNFHPSTMNGVVYVQ